MFWPLWCRASCLQAVAVHVLVLCVVPGLWGPAEHLPVARGSPLDAPPGDPRVTFVQIVKRQETTASPVPAPKTQLPAGWVPIRAPEEPAQKPPAPAADPATAAATTRPNSVGTETQGPGGGAPVADGAAQQASSPPARREGGIKSPIQFRPAALTLSMPFAVAGLALYGLVFVLALRGTAAIDSQSRRAILSAKMANFATK